MKEGLVYLYGTNRDRNRYDDIGLQVWNSAKPS